MDKKLKNGLSGVSVLLLFFLVFSQGCMAAADVPPSPPMLPMTVTGVAFINGTSAPDGTVVAAYLNEKEYLENTSSGNYSLFIPGTADDVGKPVTFKVDGKAASSSVAWESGGMVTLELPDGKAVYPEIVKSNSSSGLNSNSNTNSNSNSNTNSNSNSNTNSNSNSNTNSNSNSNSKAGSKPLVENEEQGDSAEDSKADTIESSVLEPNMTALKNTSVNSEDKEAAESSESSPRPESAPGFLIVYAVAGILLLAFGFNFGRGSRKNP